MNEGEYTLEKVQNNWPAGIKKTRQRESVLSVLEHSEKPLSATDIYSKMKKGGDAVWLSTVYRVLELFVKKGVVIKTNVMNNEMAVYELNRFKHKHYAVCMNCHKMITMDNCPMEKFIPKLEDDDFHVLGHNLEVFGFCRDCNPN
jgi:Fur family ferric uptake transcriptional regulator